MGERNWLVGVDRCGKLVRMFIVVREVVVRSCSNMACVSAKRPNYSKLWMTCLWLGGQLDVGYG